LLTESVLPECKGCAEENLTLRIESHQGIDTSVLRPVAVRPVVVSRGENHWRLQRVEKIQSLCPQGRAASGGSHRTRGSISGFQIAIVRGERQILLVHIGN
jgi:hypothetical protein